MNFINTIRYKDFTLGFQLSHTLAYSQIFFTDNFP